MKTRFIYKIFLCAVGFIPMIANGQNLVIDGEIRPRTEYRDGYSQPIILANDPGVFTSQRTRIGLNFSSGLLTTKITLQDARVFGQYGNSDEAASTGIYEAWADMMLFPGASFKIGRQSLKYDDSRLFAAPIWTISSSTHDVALFKYSINDYQAHIGMAYNNKSESATEVFYQPGSKYRSLAYLWVTTPVISGFSLSGIFVDEGLQDTLGLGGVGNYKKTNLSHVLTFGGNVKYESSDVPISGLATAYFQDGENVSNKTMMGKMAALKLNYQCTNYLSVSLGTDYFSGDKNGASDGKISNFRKLYGTNHNFNGYMDYWNTPLTSGLLDYYGSLNGKIGKNLSLEGGYHIFNTEYAGKNKKGIAYDKAIGSEVDFLITYKLNTWSTIQGGYCMYFSNNNTLIAKDIVTSAATIPAVRSPQWAYVMFTIKIPPTPKGV